MQIATVISGLANEVAALSENLLKIADRAKFKEMRKKNWRYWFSI